MRRTSTYREWTADVPATTRARNWVRDRLVSALSVGRRLDASIGWVRFIYYHHVFDDEREGFARQLDYLKRFGDFITLSHAVDLLVGKRRIDGRYFCIGFDDGLKSCVTGALPILAERQIPAAFYVVSDLVGRSFTADDPLARKVFGFRGRGTTLDFLDWKDCRALAAAGMTIGSHSRTHRRLKTLPADGVADELEGSKIVIERELGITCDHFCAPYGVPGRDFDLLRDPAIARDLGYRSFATGLRGASRAGDDPFFLRRDQVLALWDNCQLDYFLSRP